MDMLQCHIIIIIIELKFWVVDSCRCCLGGCLRSTNHTMMLHFTTSNTRSWSLKWYVADNPIQSNIHLMKKLTECILTIKMMNVNNNRKLICMFVKQSYDEMTVINVRVFID